jgi:hypothetical protein
LTCGAMVSAARRTAAAVRRSNNSYQWLKLTEI